MTPTEIKKALYKQKPIATMAQRGALTLRYVCYLADGERVVFKVPKEESENFENKMPAQLLIRWMV